MRARKNKINSNTPTDSEIEKIRESQAEQTKALKKLLQALEKEQKKQDEFTH